MDHSETNKSIEGIEPNELIQKIYHQFKANFYFLDLGCGKGRDSLFMLQNGYKVDAIDRSQENISKIEELIKINKLPLSNINLYCGDIRNFSISKNKYDIINAFNSLQFLPKRDALKIINDIKNNIKNEGYVIISSFTTSDPLYKKMSNNERCFFEPQELKNLFSDFNIIEYREQLIEDKGHPGSPLPHIHGMVRLIAQK
ncbi:MAG TPA: methyltransferase domain-containing protein [Candidatus Paceibacterota bacterium]|nr:methyltransferase domain-containing protein [Candidatus Paceibacterota bacterium]